MLRSKISVGLATIIASAAFIGAADQWESITAVKRFADALLAPQQYVGSGASAIFSAHVVGDIDILSNFTGRDLASQYIFGPFASAAKSPEDPSLFGVPTAYNVTGLTIQHSVVTASIMFDMHYAAIQQTIPLQIDGWFMVDGEDLISQFSLSFEHWSKAARAVDRQSGSTAIECVCRNGPWVSLGVFSVSRGDFGSCVAAMSSLPLGDWDNMASNTLLCRGFVSQVAAYNPAAHCPDLSAAGGIMCQNRTYAQMIAQPFPGSWDAAKVVTPENAESVASMQFTSGRPLSDLLRAFAIVKCAGLMAEISLSQNELHGWDPTLYATATFGYFLFVYAFIKLTWFIMRRFHRTFKGLSHRIRQNVVIYIAQIAFTTISLVLELVAAGFFVGEYHLWGLRCLRVAGMLVSTLYIFELIFRSEMRYPLIAHHILTVVALSYTCTMFEWTQSPLFAVTGIVWLFQATTEQPTFFGLMGYRLGWGKRGVSMTLKIAAIQTFALKTASAVYLLVFWGQKQRTWHRPMDIAFSALLWTISIGLMATQVWGSYVTYIIGVKIGKQRAPNDSDHDAENQIDQLPIVPRDGRTALAEVQAGAKGKECNQTSMSNSSSATKLGDFGED